MTNLFDSVSPAALHPMAAKAIADIDMMEARDRAAVHSRPECMEIGGWRLSTQITKEQSGALVTFLDGSVRRVTSASLYRHLRELAVASWPVDGPPRKGRNPTTGFHKRAKPRPRTEAELQGLAKGNARRAKEAADRRRVREEAEA